ncbi:hypothetical protein [Arthrobacter sp. SX1312]|nr:hypothetical protein [Arthrobacter sp. SX1312]
MIMRQAAGRAAGKAMGIGSLVTVPLDLEDEERIVSAYDPQQPVTHSTH